MKTRHPFSKQRIRAAAAGTLLILSASPLLAAEKPPVNLGEDFLVQLKVLSFILVFIGLLIGYIALVLSVKDIRRFSLRNIWEGIIGRNSADPETDHDYDGIRELDNPMPAWLRLIFIGSIIFAGVYLVHYHLLKTGSLSKEEYETEMALSAETYKSVELPDDQLVQVTDPGRLAAAATIFAENCATCHRKDLGGESGPNLTDEYWLHGGKVQEIYHTITDGVPGKSMISWKDRISSQERLAIASFILSKQGSKPAQPRAPEGVVEGQDAEPTTLQDSTVMGAKAIPTDDPAALPQ